MTHGVFLDSGSLYASDLDLASLHAVIDTWQWCDNTASVEVSRRIADAEIVISNKVVLDERALSTAKKLKLICVAATGTNNVDINAATKRGIIVCNVRNYATPAVVQHVFALLLTLRNHMIEYHASVQCGAWQRSAHFSGLEFPIAELAGKTFGVVGYGVLGQAVADVARAFGMQVVVAAVPGHAAKTPVPRLPLDQLLHCVDVLSLHCPLTPQTEKLLNRDSLALMKQDAIVINTARGGLIDEHALVAALRAGKLGGAGIDVLSTEPPTTGNPLLHTGLSNLIVTPHIAWGSREARQRLINELARNIAAFLAGTPRNVVNS